MNDLELRAWISFVDVVINLDNRWAENYRELVEKLFKSLHNIDAYMSIKVHFFK